MKIWNRGGHGEAWFATVVLFLLTYGGAATEAAEPLAPASPRTTSQDVPECTPPQSCCRSAVLPNVLGNQSRGLSFEYVRRALAAKGLNDIHRVSRPRAGTAQEKVYAVLPRPGERVCLDTRIEVYVAIPAKTTAGTNSSETNSSETNTSETNTSGTNSSETNTSETNTSETNTSETNTSETNTSGTNTSGTNTSGTNTSGTNTSGSFPPTPAESQFPAQVTAGFVITTASVGAAGFWLLARALASRVSTPTSPAQPQIPGAPTAAANASKRLRLRVRTDIG